MIKKCLRCYKEVEINISTSPFCDSCKKEFKKGYCKICGKELFFKRLNYCDDCMLKRNEDCKKRNLELNKKRYWNEKL